VQRTFDLAACALGAAFVAPVMLLVALAIRIMLGSPVLFRQKRPGLNSKIFSIYKFRSMTDERDVDGNLLPDAQRLTAFGRFLRSSSLDELPCLLNVVRGEMSLVGPRPLLPDYLPLYTPEQMRRHAVRPGITGWAQVNGRNALSWEEKFALDVWYVENRSLLLDIRILFMTVFKVLRSADIAHEGEVTMPRFTGTATPSKDH
jgi:sugar transferase EpsL